MVVGRPHLTQRYERWRIRDPRMFIRGSFRTHDIGRGGFSKRIAGRLRTGGWATQSLLIGRAEPEWMKRQLRKSAKDMIRKAKRKSIRRRL